MGLDRQYHVNSCYQSCANVGKHSTRPEAVSSIHGRDDSVHIHSSNSWQLSCQAICQDQINASALKQALNLSCNVQFNAAYGEGGKTQSTYLSGALKRPHNLVWQLRLHCAAELSAYPTQQKHHLQ